MDKPLYTINYNKTKTTKKDTKKGDILPEKLFIVKYHSLKLDRVVYQSKLYKSTITPSNIQKAIDSFLLDCKPDTMEVIEYNKA